MRMIVVLLAACAALFAGAAERVPDEVKAREAAHYRGTDGSAKPAKPAKRVPDEVTARETAAHQSGVDVWTAGTGLTPVGIDIMRGMVNELWADYTNRMERIRRAKAARHPARVRNVDGRPPVRPVRFKVPGEGGAK